MDFSVSNYIKQHNLVMESLCLDELQAALELISNCHARNCRIAVCGNGGSALCASHYITDWNKMVHLGTGKKFNGICLNDNIGLITAYANDISYDKIFSEQVKNLLLPNDLLICVSGSGNSKNVLEATRTAQNLGVKTLSIVGFDGGQLKSISDFSVWIKSFDMQICEDAHVLFGHIVMKYLCNEKINV